jgi:hypothetical protein
VLLVFVVVPLLVFVVLPPLPFWELFPFLLFLELLFPPVLLIELTDPPNILVDPPAKSDIVESELRIPITFNAVFWVTLTVVPNPTISEQGLFVPYCENMLLVQASNVPFVKSF